MPPEQLVTNGEFLRSKILGKLGVQEVHLTTGSVRRPPELLSTMREFCKAKLEKQGQHGSCTCDSLAAGLIKSLDTNTKLHLAREYYNP